jgi:hypothetical protein
MIEQRWVEKAISGRFACTSHPENGRERERRRRGRLGDDAKRRQGRTPHLRALAASRTRWNGEVARLPNSAAL